ncbi:MAG: excinuclease ABC subunit A [Candidatus Cloacimonadota bacterium]|nr:MAG: excinuclease ABC subunit A [Candidatus Cloacimonadota bacterium]
MEEKLIVKGAKEHNLKDVYIELPKKKLVVFTGVSGSGKSSLAFDTIYAEGQRRYVESLSSYARQFLGQMEKPHYDYIKGLSPTISIEQKSASKNPRSTVGTVTEIYDYLRVLFARIGKQHCTKCNQPVGQQSAQNMVDNIMQWDDKTKVIVLAPKISNRKGEHKEIFLDAMKSGFSRVRVNGEIISLEESIKLDDKRKHNIEIVIDRLVMKSTIKSRLTDSIEMALEQTDGTIIVRNLNNEEDVYFSENLACVNCQISFPEISPQNFSFNSPLGMCSPCNGLGSIMAMDENSFILDENLSIQKGAIIPWANALKRRAGWTYRMIIRVLAKHNIDKNIPFKDISQQHKNFIFYGSLKKKSAKLQTNNTSQSSGWQGIINNSINRIKENANNGTINDNHAKHLKSVPCPDCCGARIRKESQFVKVSTHSINTFCALTIQDAFDFLNDVKFSGNDEIISSEIKKELTSRLKFLVSVGLNYLTLDRLAPSLSGGESQRIRLASQIGSELTGVLYVLDEPSIGLHQRDNDRLIETLKHLRDIGNSVLVVEHDQDTISEADYIVDFGPGAGKHGGEIVFAGTYKQLLKSKKSLTAKYITGEKKIFPDLKRIKKYSKYIKIKGARQNNLKNIDVQIPISCFSVITGVSGAGKSSLINGILWPAAQNYCSNTKNDVGEHDSIKGLDNFESVIDINQSPIGRTPRSNPATYVKVFDMIRTLFSELEESKVYGYKAGRFSFNVKGGRCESCQGAGLRKVEMHFLPDVYVQCEDCLGHRFNDATLRVKLKGLNISDILNLSVGEAVNFFENFPRIYRILKTLDDVGLGYITLGQSATTLSGGEAQRIKLAKELARRPKGKTMYILDEPTTGLHFEDIHKLIVVLKRLVENGHSVIVIEHNLDVIRCADYCVDIGPDGGDKGGQLVFQGPLEDLCNETKSFTGKYLKEVLEKE